MVYESSFIAGGTIWRLSNKATRAWVAGYPSARPISYTFDLVTVISAKTFSIRDARMVVTDFSYMLSFVNASDSSMMTC